MSHQLSDSWIGEFAGVREKSKGEQSDRVDKVQLPVEIGAMDLPKDHSIVEIVAEGISGGLGDERLTQGASLG